MKKLSIFALGLGLALTGPAAFAQDEETTGGEKLPGYLPPSVYPAVYVFGGVAKGPTYEGAEGLTELAAETGGSRVLEDIGTMPAFGVGFDFFVWKGLAAELKLTHEIGRRYDIALKFSDDVALPGERFGYSGRTAFEESISYKFQNVDYKLGFRYAFFPDWLVTPYAGAGLGGNLTLFDIVDEVSNPAIQKRYEGFLMGTGKIKQFSFDYALAAGVQINVGDYLFFVLEYDYDNQFREHHAAGYKYNTGLEAYFAGVGWRFPG
jgi:opacity protein-like surface antigen